MLRLIKFAEVIEPGKLFMLEPVLAEKPLKGEPPWQLQNALAVGQVRKESAPQFLALIQFVEGKGAWKLSDSEDDLASTFSQRHCSANRTAPSWEAKYYRWAPIPVSSEVFDAC